MGVWRGGISKEFAIIRAQTQIGKTFFLLRSFFFFFSFFSWSVVAHGVVIHLFFPPKKIDHRVIRKVTRLEPDNSNTWDTRWVDVMYVRVIHKVTRLEPDNSNNLDTLWVDVMYVFGLSFFTTRPKNMHNTHNPKECLGVTPRWVLASPDTSCLGKWVVIWK